ncbi:MAG: hypothetical protein LBU85_06745 [Treponema sp.]|jgi:hypothetical protein|nr:hypothetical protein [Treponema sp.]
MEIRINGQIADIVPDSEKTVGEILAGIEQWLANSGNRLSGFVFDGETADTGSMDAAFGRDINSVKTLDIFTSSLAELAAQGLAQICRDIEEYESLGFDGKQKYYKDWSESPQARFTAEQMPELFTLCKKTFSDGDLSPRMLLAITEERLQELDDPAGELAALEPLVGEACARLEDLPLDIQTGKDGRAAQTVQIFSSIAEKIFRIYNALKAEGLAADEIRIEQTELAGYIAEFGTVVNDMMAAFQQHDTVLVGDLAEYELAPRLRMLYGAIVKMLHEPAAVIGS